MNIETIIFDLDGTLLDTTEGVLESAIYAAKKMGYSELPHNTMLEFVGPPIQNSFIQHYGCTKGEAQIAANIFREYYKSYALFKARPYDGIYEMCEQLRQAGKKMAVATYKREDYAITLLKYFGFDKYFGVMHGADNNNRLTKTDIVKLCIDETYSKPEETVLVGDTKHDAEGAKESSIHFIAVTYGFGFKSVEQTKMYSCCGVAGVAKDIVKIVLGEQGSESD